jgi:ABC-type transport system involved in multi-copper enzyme maturation permease subunit
VGLVSKEIERRSLYPLLAKPVSRTEFFLGKFAGLAFTLLVNVTVMAAGLFLTLWVTGRSPDPLLLKAVYPIYLSLLLVVALALLFSSVTSTAIAAVCTVGVVVGGRFSDVIRNMREVAPGAPSWLVELLYYAVPNFRNFDFKDKVSYGDPVPWSVLGFVTLYGALYTAIALALGLWSFRSRDFQ